MYLKVESWWRASRPAIAAGALFVASAVLTPQPARAQTVNWTGAASESWFDAGNWIGGIPDGGDTIIIDSVVPNPAVLSEAAQVMAIGIGDSGTGALTLQGGTLTVLGNLGSSVIIGNLAGSAGTLNIGAASTDAADATTPGTLIATDVLFGAGGGTLNFNHTGTGYVFAPRIWGPGAVNVIAGTTILTGDNTYTGGTTIGSAGTLQIGNGGTSGDLSGNTVNDGALIFNRSDASTYTGIISGSGSVTKTGAGTLTLEGANTYSGPTIISGGTLVAGTDDALSNNSDFTIGTGGTLEIAAAVWSTIGSLDNDGALVIGDNARLSTDALSGAGSIALGDFAALYVVGANTTTFSGSITGDGDFGIDGDGTLILTGTSSIGGVLSICTCGGDGTLAVTEGGSVETLVLEVDGTMQVDGAGSSVTVADGTVVGWLSAGELTISNGGVLNDQAGAAISTMFGTGSTATVTGIGSRWNIDGTLDIGDSGWGTTGTLTVSDGGAVNATGTVGVTAGSTLNLGTGGLAGAFETPSLVNDGTIAADFTDTLTLAADITGGGDLTKNGSGTLTLSGDSSLFTGTTTVNAGKLVLADLASLGGDVVVGSGGTLSGTGAFGGSLTVNGVLAPGNSIGEMTVAGPLTFTAGSFFDVEANEAGQADRVNVTGTATLAGTVRALPAAGAYAAQTDYVILTATDPIVTTFDAVTTNSAFLDPSLLYGTNEVTLRLTRNSTAFADVAATPNQKGAAGALDAGANGATGDLATLVGTITGLSTAEAQVAFEQLSGASLTTLPTVQLASTESFAASVQAGALRQTALGSGGAGGSGFAALASQGLDLDGMAEIGTALGRIGPALSAAPGANERAGGVWLSGYGIAGEVDGDGNAHGFIHRTGGALAGIDWETSHETAAGVALGYARSEIDPSDSDDEARIGTVQASLYGVWRPAGHDDRLVIDGALGVGRSEYDSERHIVFGGLDRTAEGETWGYDLSARVGAGWRHDAGAYRLTPRAGLSAAHIHQEAYTETGAGAANLSVEDRETNSLRSRLALEGARDFVAADGAVWTPALTLAWRHEFADTERITDAAFVSVPTAPFRVEGVEASRDALEIGARVAVAGPDGADWSVGYATSLASGETAHALFATLRLAW